MRAAAFYAVAATFGAAMLLASPTLSLAENAEAKPADKARAGDAAKGDAAKGDAAKKVDEFAEAERLLGGPAAKPECIWLGRRVVSLLWRDDLDTALRQLELYDRFGCPASHIQAAFRCVVRQGSIDPKATDTINGRVHGCWLNPEAPTKGTAEMPSPTTSR